MTTTEPLPHERDAPPAGLEAACVVPARDAAATIAACVRALRAQRDGTGRPVRVLVVDDGSLDRTAEVARAAGAEVLTAGGDGPARARNLGVAAVSAPVVIFTDADCAPRPGFVAALLAPLADPAVVGSKGSYETEQRALVARFIQREYEERYARMARRATIDFVDTYAAAYRRDALLAAGGFDERYRRPSTEDQELSFRLAAAGARLVFAPAARVAHLHAATLGGYARKKARIGYYKVATLRRHPARAVSDAHTPAGLKLQVALAPFAWAGLTAALVALAGALAIAGAGPQGEALTAAGAASWARPELALLGLLPLVLLLLSAAPLLWRALRADPAVGLVAPLLVLVRATALAAGVARGLLAELGGGILPAGPALGAAARSAGGGQRP